MKKKNSKFSNLIYTKMQDRYEHLNKIINFRMHTSAVNYETRYRIIGEGSNNMSTS